MPEQLGTVELLARELARAFTPLQTRLSSGGALNLLAELGLRFPPQLTANPAFSGALNTVATTAGELPALVQQLIAATEAEDVNQILNVVGQIIDKIQELIPAIDTIATQLNAVGPTLPGMVAAEVTAFANALPERLIDYVLVTYLETYYPVAFSVLQLLGIAEREPQPGGGDATHPPYLRRRIRFDRIPQFLQSPDAILTEVYGWGTAGLNADLLLARIHTILIAMSIPATWVPPAGTNPGQLQLILLKLRPTSGPPPRGLEFVADASLPGEVTFTAPIFAPGWSLIGTARARVEAGLAVRILPPLEVTLVPSPPVSVEGEISLKVRGANPTAGQPYRIFGQQNGTRLEANAIEAGALGLFRWNAASNRADGDAGFEARIEQGRVVIALGGADGFLASILPADGFSFNFDFGVGYTGQRGLFFSGSAGLEANIALHASLGPVSIETLYLMLHVDAASLDLEVSVAAGATIGPIAASVDRVGALARLRFQEGNLGPVDLSFAFKPPNGLGIVVDAGPITGGGYIFLDYNIGRYAGILQLEIFGIAVTAIGILDTQLPGGVTGYSFLIIIAAEFPPIQLGYGFTLNGVGGLAGIHRTIVTEALQSGVRNGTIDSIMFPTDPVANATQIISNLSAIFPPLQNHYVFGPMAMIGWGTPTLIKVELGIILELPDPIRIVILGQLSAALPTEDAAIVELHIDIVGIIDTGGKFFSLDGSLHDSRVALFSLWGDMAVRLRWGDDPSFALSIGGLNPHFQPPPNFPVLRRLTVALGAGENPRISLQCYMALTSNSVQFGARAELYAAAAGFNVYGWIGFDVLVIFSPFSFRADFSAGIALRRGTSTIAGVHLSATLTGPTPWHAWGEATLSLFFFDISVGFDVTFGEERREELPPADVWIPLQAALQDARNWSAALPPAAARVVAYVEPGAATPLLVDPMGTITVRQKVAPLNRTLEKFGETRPSGANRFNLERISIGTDTLTGWSPVRDHFAPGHFEELTDDEKLSRDSFEKMDAGAQLSAASVTAGAGVGTEIEYETIIIDSPWDSHAAPLYVISGAVLNAVLRVSAAALGGIRNEGLERYITPGAAPAIAFEEEEFVVVSADDLTARFDISAAASRTDATLALKQYLAANPQDKGNLLIVPRHEAEAA